MTKKSKKSCVLVVVKDILWTSTIAIKCTHILRDFFQDPIQASFAHIIDFYFLIVWLMHFWYKMESYGERK